MIGVILDLSVKNDQLDSFLSMMENILPETRAYPGCQTFEVWVDKDRPGRVVLNETWDSQELHQTYLEWRSETGVLETLVSFLNSPPQPMYFDILQP